MLNNHVVPQFTFAEIFARAHIARERRHTSVRAHVLPRMVLLGEGARTHATLERLFARVRPHVPHHAVGEDGRVRTQGAEVQLPLASVQCDVCPRLQGGVGSLVDARRRRLHTVCTARSVVVVGGLVGPTRWQLNGL